MTKKLLFFIIAFVCMIIPAVSKDIRDVTFKVQQMECPNCEKKVKNNIRFEKGVKSIQTNVEQRTVIITYDADKTNVTRLQTAFKKFDYTAVLIPTIQKTDSIGKKQ